MSRFTDEMPNLKGKIAIAPLPVFDSSSTSQLAWVVPAPQFTKTVPMLTSPLNL